MFIKPTNVLMSTFVVLIVIPATVVPPHVYAQSGSAAEDSSFGKGRLNTVDGYKIDFLSITFDSETFTYKIKKPRSKSREHGLDTKNSYETVTVDADSVFTVEIQGGTKAVEAAALFGLVGFASSWSAVKRGRESIEAVGGESDSGTETTFIIGATAGMTLLGALIGSAVKEYEIVYTRPEKNIKPNSKKLGVILQGHIVMVSISF